MVVRLVLLLAWWCNSDFKTVLMSAFIAVEPEVAAKSLIEWAEQLDISKTGEYWAPRGPRK